MRSERHGDAKDDADRKSFEGFISTFQYTRRVS